jgi:hypothetical protein
LQAARNTVANLENLRSVALDLQGIYGGSPDFHEKVIREWLISVDGAEHVVVFNKSTIRRSLETMVKRELNTRKAVEGLR